MAVIKVVYTLMLVAFVGFLFFGQSPQFKDGRIVRSGRKSGPKVKLHKATAEVNPKLDHIAFDPKVAEFEQKYDDRMWEREYFRHHKEEMERHRRLAEHEGLEEAPMGDHEASAERAIHHGFNESALEDYNSALNDIEPEDEDYLSSGNFNITDRLSVLFPIIDQNPLDGFVSLEELTQWHIQQARNTSIHRTVREMEVTDSDGDGLISLKEYLHDQSPGEEVQMEDSEDVEWIRQAKDQFPLADLDKDGKLNTQEFNDFLHPEDSDNVELHKYLIREEIRHRDKDKDGKISFAEFYDNLYDELRDFEEEDPVDTAVRSHVGKDPHEARGQLGDAMETKVNRARAMFDGLDTDKDGHLAAEEVLPMLEKLQPGERHYARQQAEHMVDQADGNKDKKLTLQEMIEHPYVFYNVAYEEEEEDEVNDEFR